MSFETRHIHVRGIVQGVGMRPFVYRLAQEHALAGWVLNAHDGVHIEVSGSSQQLDGFQQALVDEAPPAARIEEIIVELCRSEIRQSKTAHFSIRLSEESRQIATLVSPDLATCDACLQELTDPSDRRYHYPFINCTNCGPRFTIIERLPYDRPTTTMASFAFCPQCEHEYNDPADRRFHAQSNACFDCGPRLSLRQAAKDRLKSGDTVIAENRVTSDELIASSVALLRAGSILAIKSLGGYHLACDASNEAAVQGLRDRKRRPHRPLALMMPSVEFVRKYCVVDELEAALLTSPARPIVLLRIIKESSQKSCPSQNRPSQSCLNQNCPSQSHPAILPMHSPTPIAPSIAGRLPELGIMLPATPLQHLLLEAMGTPLVMTSGNLSSEPIIAREEEAHRILAQVADAFLDNDRAISARYDDSVVRVISKRTHMIRRARGYAPLPLKLPWAQNSGSFLATGSEQKSTFCLTRGSEAFVSQHLGDLENAASFSNYLQTIKQYQQLFDVHYDQLVCDKHPEYLASKWARAHGLSYIEVQHHHAHIAAVLAENTIASERVIGIAFDGAGYGDDGAIWGGEVLIASTSAYERFAHLAYVPLVGGQAAIKHPMRMAYALLTSYGLLDHPGAQRLLDALGAQTCSLLDQMITARINTPQTSSMGRLFDAASALLGICEEETYDGQAAIELEAALPVSADNLLRKTAVHYRFERIRHGTVFVLDAKPVIKALLDDYAAGLAVSVIAQRFHDAVCMLILDSALAAREATNINTVALSGGVFMNRYLVTRAVPLLEAAGFSVLLHKDLPANDGCISYGQAAVASAHLERIQH